MYSKNEVEKFSISKKCSFLRFTQYIFFIMVRFIMSWADFHGGNAWFLNFQCVPQFGISYCSIFPPLHSHGKISVPAFWVRFSRERRALQDGPFRRCGSTPSRKRCMSRTWIWVRIRARIENEISVWVFLRHFHCLGRKPINTHGRVFWSSFWRRLFLPALTQID